MFQHPFTMFVSGATGSGKTVWLKRFLENAPKLIDNCPENIMYAYGELNSTILSIPGIRLHSGCPDEETVKAARDSKGRLLLILDDLMLNIKEQYLNTLFTKGSHNWNVSVIFVAQQTFTKKMRTARQNSHYILLTRNPPGEDQVRNLGAQLYPGRLPFFMEVYHDACRENFSYLLIDMHPSTPDNQRLKTYIYPGENTIVYTPR